MTLLEPLRGQQLLIFCNNIVTHNYYLQYIVPLLADSIVMLYPIYLPYIYLKGYYNNQKGLMQLGLLILVVCIIGIVINLLLQGVIIKSRPEQMIDAIGGLLLNHLPTAPFPSDHATVSWGFFMSLWLGSGKLTHPIHRNVILFFGIGSIVMCVSRIAVGVHWPTDIIAGYIVGTIVALVVVYPPIHKFFDQNVYTPCIKLQHFCFRLVGISNEQIKL